MPRKTYLVGERYLRRWLCHTLERERPADYALLDAVETTRVTEEPIHRLANRIAIRKGFPRPYYNAQQREVLALWVELYERERVDVFLRRVILPEIQTGTWTALAQQVEKARRALCNEDTRMP